MKDYMRMYRKTDKDIQAWLDSQSVVIARQIAAIGAFSRYREITVTDQEISDQVADSIKKTGASVKDAMDQVRAQGKLEEIRMALINEKAINIILDESNCTYDNNKPLDKYDRVYGYPTIRFF